MPAPVQLAYRQAEARLQAIALEVQVQSEPLDAQLEGLT